MFPQAAVAPVEGGDPRPEAEVPPQDDDYRRPLQLYRHWVR